MPEDDQRHHLPRFAGTRWRRTFSSTSTSKTQQHLLRGMAHEQVVAILNEMSPDDRTALLEEMPSAAARQLIKLLTPEERRIAQALLGYPEGSVGRLMTPDFIAVRRGLDGEGSARLRARIRPGQRDAQRHLRGR